MCYNVQQKASIKELTEQFNATFEMPALYNPKQNISGFDHPLLPVIKDENPEVFQFLNWGLIPHWAKDDHIRKHTLNAKKETIKDVASFRDVTQQRCVLPVTGFYEWKWLDGKGKRKEKYLIQLQNEAVFGLAGLYSTWINPLNGENTNSFTLLTTAANDIMAEIHNTKKRMPLIMDIQQAQNWLRKGEDKLSRDLKTTCIESDGQLGLFG
ncbi:SOS response-associated peptidase [Brumimicrobium aurantiacum]|uniref:Abasic site processing protein n=1 Tax=Brumimicrobium aurantiacum TaxID=1737063 RepID=A0A3E1F0K4_9FLAO|nr:SOS response-associated peptidase [Brumimicrobium aurantiacum]RFC55334.1 SOS response-associated peptidase [Brumimicrobium aurantiacum]